jgi:hypothetical protein
MHPRLREAGIKHQPFEICWFKPEVSMSHLMSKFGVLVGIHIDDESDAPPSIGSQDSRELTDASPHIFDMV